MSYLDVVHVPRARSNTSYYFCQLVQRVLNPNFCKQALIIREIERGNKRICTHQKENEEWWVIPTYDGNLVTSA
jgi:hypothetical protein